MEVLKYTLKKIPDEVPGSYRIFDSKLLTIGSSVGHNLIKRNIEYTDYSSKKKYVLAYQASNKDILYIYCRDEIICTIPMDTFYSKVSFQCLDGSTYTLICPPRSLSYKILQNEKEVGIVSANKMLSEDIGIAIVDQSNLPILFCVVISIVFRKELGI